MDVASVCYVCEKTPAKRCTGCLLISYCGCNCQKADWKYHKASCLQKSVNVIDSLIKLTNIPHILRRICLHLSGKDLHNFCRVKRSWRDLAKPLLFSECDRKLLKKKLDLQWSNGDVQVKTMFRSNSEIVKIDVNGSEVFVDIFRKKEIRVYDVTTNRLKYTLENDERGGVWDVHKDFLIIYDGNKIYGWDRRLREKIDIGDDSHMQIGGHYRKNEDDEAEYPNCEYLNTKIKPENDAPIIIKIFSASTEWWSYLESGIVITYKSGLVQKWYYKTPYEEHYNFLGEKEIVDKFVFEHTSSYNHLSKFNIPFHLSDKLWLSQPTSGDNGDSFLKLFFLNGNCLQVLEMEYVFKYFCTSEICGVDKILDFYESSDLSNGVTYEEGLEGYLILERNFDTIFEEFKLRREFFQKFQQGNIDLTLEEWEASQIVKEDDYEDDNLDFLEIHVTNSTVSGDFVMRRRMRMRGIMYACMNDEHLVTACQYPISYNHLDIYSAKTLIADEDFCENEEIDYVKDPFPLRIIDLGMCHVPDGIFLSGVNRLFWWESIDHWDIWNDHDEEVNLMYINFWMV